MHMRLHALPLCWRGFQPRATTIIPPLFSPPPTPFKTKPGEALAVLDYLALCNCAKDAYTLSPFRNLHFAQEFAATRDQALRLAAADWGANNPALFFTHL